MNIIEIKNRTTLDELYESDAICLIGLVRESLPEYLEWLKEEAKVKLKPDFKMFRVKGDVMDNSYGLTGDNRYPDDLNIWLISMNDVESLGSLPVKRLEIDGLKWFCDVVDNNEIRERDQR